MFCKRREVQEALEEVATVKLDLPSYICICEDLEQKSLVS